MTDEKLRSSCMNVLEGAKEMGAKFYAAPFGIRDSDHMIDVTDIIIAALEKAVEGEQPTIAEWEDKWYYFGQCGATCSNCGKESSGSGEDTGWGFDYEFPKICGHCGAIMVDSDEDGDDDETD